MIAHSAETTESLCGVPGHQRHRILTGMRWTVWLAVLAMPFSALTTILLGRAGPEVLGTYGLLSVYVAFVSSFLYFGGDVVVINFIPQCAKAERAPFLLSYLLLTCGSAIPWIGVAALWPGLIEKIIGHNGGTYFDFYLLCFAPVQIAFSMMVAAHKGMLDIAWAQFLYRSLGVGTCFVYTLLYFAARSVLVSHYALLVWAVYIGLLVFLGGAAFIRFIKINGWGPTLIPRFLLPRGFWAYSLATQQVSITNFLMQRLDYILILNIAGLKTLGQYVMIVTVANLIQQVNSYFLDTLLPALTNLIGARNEKGAAQVFMMHMRIVCLVDVAATAGLMVFAVPITKLMGPRYAPFVPEIVLAALLLGLSNPGNAGGTILASIGKQRRAAWVATLQIGIFVCLFFALWRPFGLVGAVGAYGLSALSANAILLAVALCTTNIYPSVTRMFVALTSTLLPVAAAVLWWRPLGIPAAVAVWIFAVCAYLWLARYGLEECISLAGHFLPASAKLERFRRWKDDRKTPALVESGTGTQFVSIEEGVPQ